MRAVCVREGFFLSLIFTLSNDLDVYSKYKCLIQYCAVGRWYNIVWIQFPKSTEIDYSMFAMCCVLSAVSVCFHSFSHNHWIIRIMCSLSNDKMLIWQRFYFYFSRLYTNKKNCFYEILAYLFAVRPSMHRIYIFNMNVNILN